jgi:hypothetical protein
VLRHLTKARAQRFLIVLRLILSEKKRKKTHTHTPQGIATEARILKFTTKSIKRQRVILYRLHFRAHSMKSDEWLEEVSTWPNIA